MTQSQQPASVTATEPVVEASIEASVNTRAAAPPTSRNRTPLPYGYHNSFHTHSWTPSPPTYELSQKLKKSTAPSLPEDDLSSPPPPYTCTVSKGGVVGLMMEFRDPFMGQPTDKLWQKVYASLRGTQLSIHWIKFRLNSKKSIPQPGKKIAQFSLQHAEVGLAVDTRAAENMPKSAVLHLLPSNVREKLMRTKPQLFEMQNEWLLRIRVEGFQFLMSLDSEESLLDWCEQLCTSIDISPPIDDRTDPRYRSLPRRSRRQRQLENYVDGRFQDSVPPSIETLNNRLVEEQERILRTFYPNLATAANGDRGSLMPLQRPVSNVIEMPSSGDNDMDEFDPADAMELAVDRSQSGFPGSGNRLDNRSKSSFQTTQDPRPCSEAEIRFRRRCMPIMYKFSARGSDIIFYKGARWRIDHKRCVLRSFEMSPPRYPRVGKKTKTSPHTAATVQDSLRPQKLSAAQQAEGGTSYRTASGYSGRVEDSDAVSVTSVANTTGSAHDGIESVSRVVSMFNAHDEIAENPNSPDVTMMLKEKATMSVRRASQSDQVAHAFASLVL